LGLININGFFGVEEPSTPLCVPEVPPPSKGTPSTTNRGSLLPLIEDVPLILIVTAAPGSPLEGVIVTPGVRPCISCSGVEITPLLKSFVDSAATDPVASLTLLVP